MKVLHIVSWFSQLDDKDFFTGVFHYELVKALNEKCEAAIWYPYDRSIKNKIVKCNERGVLVFRSFVNENKALLIFKCIDNLKYIISEFKPDIIHAHVGRFAGFIAVIIGRLFKLPVVITEHEPVQLMKLDKWKNRVKLKYAYNNSSYNICVSEYLNKEFSKIFKNTEFHTIYNGVEDPKTLIPKEKNDFRISKCINSIIIAGFYDKEIKGFQYLLPALKEVNNSSSPKVFLHICGDGKYLLHYKQIAKDLGVDQYCCFYGFCERSKLFQIVEQMDFGISASLFESAGVSIEEMLLLGKPVVVTKSGGVNSLVSDFNSIVVEKGSTEQLVNGISKMIMHYKDFDNELIRTNALESYEMKHIVDKHITIYQSVIDNRLL